MSDLAGLLSAIQGALVERGCQFALVGGLAVSVHTEPRFTRDLGLVVAVADDNAAEMLVRELGDEGWAMHSSLEHDVTGRLALEVLGGLRLPVATLAHLVALKILSVERERPQDEVDLAALLGTASNDDVDQARRALELIEERGCSRQRDLVAMLDERLRSDRQ